MATRYTSKRDIAQLFLEQEGRCKKCRVKLKDKFEIDHIVPLWNGGADTLDNKRVLCVSCHKFKTFGPKATIYGSDVHEFHKTERLKKGKKPSRSRWPKRKFREQPE
jgi:5-methylcytosine-specific restriction endonuclease McrA